MFETKILCQTEPDVGHNSLILLFWIKESCTQREINQTQMIIYLFWVINELQMINDDQTHWSVFIPIVWKVLKSNRLIVYYRNVHDLFVNLHLRERCSSLISCFDFDHLALEKSDWSQTKKYVFFIYYD